MRKIAEVVPAYIYGSSTLALSEVSLSELELLKSSAGFTSEDESYLRLAGEVLTGQTKQDSRALA